MNFLGSRRGKIAVVAAVILALLSMRPGAGRLRTQIVRSISLALERPVEVASVSLHLLPRPGFDLRGFVVHEDPSFGDEPMLRAEQVTASLRLTSLFRGRLEISRLSLTEPSLNLVENSAGHWNLENLLERADRTPVAPTSKSKNEIRPGFPYIEADQGRINFKLGQEKKPYALTDANFSIWQDSENTWGMRLRAQPVRTDFNLSDTGTVRVSGSWQRARTLRETPVQFGLQWEHAQLGQVTKLVYGRDLGWRGTIGVSVALTGTPADLAISTSDSVDDFRRYDLPGNGTLRLAIQCNAHYRSVDHALPGVSCQAPIGGGFLRLDGSVAGTPGSRTYDLALLAQDVPIEGLVALAEHAKKDVPEDLVATGKLDAAFKFERKMQGRQAQLDWSGGGQTRGFAIASALARTELTLDAVPFSVVPGTGLGQHTGGAPPVAPPSMARFAALPHVEIGPFNLPLGRPTPAVVRASLSRSDYGFEVVGDAQIRKLLQVARAIGLSALQPTADGVAKVDLQISGSWSAFTPPLALGSAQLQSVHAEMRGLNEPVEIASASLLLAPNKITASKVTASVATSTWRGSFELPRQCGLPGSCPVRFDLHADAISTDALSELFDPHPRNRPWYRFLSTAPESRNPYLLTLAADGRLTADRVTLHKLAASRVSANVELRDGVLRLTDVQGDVLGGKHVGIWKADFRAKPPAYSGSGTLDRIALGQLAQSMHDGWITGIGTATYQAAADGLTAGELMSSASAAVKFEASGGMLPHIVLSSGAAPLRMRYFIGRLLLRDAEFEIQEGKLDTPDGVYQVSGTATLGRDLNLNLMRAGARSFSITGPLTEPRVTEANPSETRAALKP